MIPQFIMHTHTKREQSAAYQKLRQAAESASADYDESRALLQVDWSENYTCIEQNEVQSGHWAHQSVSLYTYSLWYCGEQHAGVLTTDKNDHSKTTIVPFMDKILDKWPDCVTHLDVFTDGPSSQFKNRYMIAIVPALEAEHNIALRWHYFATSHGKGPVDGIEGSAKRFVWNMVRSGNAQVTNSESFVKAATGMKNVYVEHMTEQETRDRAAKLNQETVFQASSAVGGVRQIHCFQVINGEVRTADLTKDLDVTPPREEYSHSSCRYRTTKLCSGSIRHCSIRQ